jgi:hypothetical protein
LLLEKVKKKVERYPRPAVAFVKFLFEHFLFWQSSMN